MDKSMGKSAGTNLVAASQAELRLVMKERRLAQDREQADICSRRAQETILASPLWRGARAVALYAAAKGETDTRLLFEQALLDGKTAYFPRVRKNEPGVMDFVAVRGKEDFARGKFGLFEPGEELEGVPRERFCADLAVIPGLAFTLEGDRVGFGGGYYDRFFTDTGIRTRIALCFAFQLVASLPRHPWDVPVTHVCTEEGLCEVVRPRA